MGNFQVCSLTVGCIKIIFPYLTKSHVITWFEYVIDISLFNVILQQNKKNKSCMKILYLNEWYRSASNERIQKFFFGVVNQNQYSFWYDK